MTTAQKVIKYLAIAFAIFLIVNIVSGILWGIFGFTFIFGLNTENQVITEEMSTTNFEYENINILDIDIAFSSLKIRNGEEFKIETNNTNINCSQNNDIIHIDEKRHKWFKRNNVGDLIIYIPKDLEFEKIKINTGAGKIDIEKITTKRLSLEIGAGEAKIEELNVTDEAKIDGGAGKVTILSGKINNLDLDMGVGSLEVNAELKGSSDIDAGIGELKVNINAPKEDYNIKVSKGIGNITIDGKSVSDDTTYGDGENDIRVDGGIGNIRIDFK